MLNALLLKVTRGPSELWFERNQGPFHLYCFSRPAAPLGVGALSGLDFRTPGKSADLPTPPPARPCTFTQPEPPGGAGVSATGLRHASLGGRRRWACLQGARISAARVPSSDCDHRRCPPAARCHRPADSTVLKFRVHRPSCLPMRSWMVSLVPLAVRALPLLHPLLPTHCSSTTLLHHTARASRPANLPTNVSSLLAP